MIRPAKYTNDKNYKLVFIINVSNRLTIVAEVALISTVLDVSLLSGNVKLR